MIRLLMFSGKKMDVSYGWADVLNPTSAYGRVLPVDMCALLHRLSDQTCTFTAYGHASFFQYQDFLGSFISFCFALSWDLRLTSLAP